MKIIKDEYGKKIGGSKRDLWKARGLMLQDIEDMNEAEKESYVKKENIWKKPDYQTLKDDGTDVGIIYYIKIIRDSIAVRPVNASEYELYIEGVRDIMDAVASIIPLNTFTEARKHMLQFLKDSGYASNTGWSWTLNRKMYAIGGSRLFKAVATDEYKIRSAVKKHRFLYSEEDIILLPYEFIEKNDSYKAETFMEYEGGADTDCKLVCGSNWRRVFGLTKDVHDTIPENSILVLKNRVYLSFAGSFEEAKKAVIAAEKNLSSVTGELPEKKERKKKFVPVQLEEIKRTVNGEENQHIFYVTGEDYISTFAFHGIEFGNYMTDLDRQASLNMAYDAFEDLARVLSVSTTDISLNGQLSVAFGARGSGNAMAHYEPLRQVINLTKMRGTGSLAHEYGHALDYILGETHNGRAAFSEAGKAQSYPPFEEVKQVMKRKKNGDKTDFYRDALSFDLVHSKDAKGYWHSDVELFARAFACYVKDELAKQGIRNDYLCGHADTGVSINTVGDVIYAYPRGEEREEINKAIKKLVNSLITDGLLPCTIRQSA